MQEINISQFVLAPYNIFGVFISIPELHSAPLNDLFHVFGSEEM